MRLISLVLFVAVASGCVSTHEPSAAAAPRHTLRVMSYNIHHGQGVDGKLDLGRIASIINEHRPEFVALQEVDRVATRSGGVNQIATLAALTEMHGEFGRFMSFQGGAYGLAVLSRHPILDATVIELPPGSREPRSALLVVTKPEWSSVPVGFVSLHLDWIDEAVRTAQVTELLSRLAGFDGPLIIAGDFNAGPGSDTMRLVSEAFEQAPKQSGSRLTFDSTTPTIEIDFVAFRGAVFVGGRAWVVDERIASDHRPVMAEIFVR